MKVELAADRMSGDSLRGFDSFSLPMKIELADDQTKPDDELQQNVERLLQERNQLLALQASLFAQQQAYTQMVAPPLTPAFSTPPGLLIPPQKQRKAVAFDDNSDVASTCSGSVETEVTSNSDALGTTVIMRNIPNRFSHTGLAAVMDTRGFSGVYDLIYVPLDFATGVSFGYAFVNLSSVEEADRFIASFDGYRWGGSSQKVCAVVRCCDDETPSERVERYRNLPVMHSSVPDSFKPALYSAGQRVPFPAPTKRLRVPRIQCPAKKE
jgi:hypothetical protein